MRLKKQIELQSKKILETFTIKALSEKLKYPETTLWRKLNGITKMDVELIDSLERHGLFKFKGK